MVKSFAACRGTKMRLELPKIGLRAARVGAVPTVRPELRLVAHELIKTVHLPGAVSIKGSIETLSDFRQPGVDGRQPAAVIAA